MIRLRPVRASDHPALMELAREAGFGMTSLPQKAEILEEKIANAVKSFAGEHPYPRQETFLFVLEEVETGAVIGCTGIKAHVGLTSPFYSYKLSTITQASKDLGIYSLQKVLHMVNDYTGATEIGSLYLKASHRSGGLGQFLSRARFLMIAEFADLFDETVIAEMRGINDANGDSPFYNNLARHFFQMPFFEADYTHATKGGQFITDLMPRYPIYVALLSPEAQAVIMQPHEHGRGAMRILDREGFHCAGYIDIFDGGPTMEAERDTIRTVRKSRHTVMSELVEPLPAEAPCYMLCTTELSNVRMGLSPITELSDGSIGLPRDVAAALGLEPGMSVRIALLD